MLHFIQDADDPQGVVKILRDALAPGSYLVLTHAVATLVAVTDRRPDDRLLVGEAPLPGHLLAGAARKPPG
ncbi:SAM-dependent methyltransferase [Nonomuraea sp. 10N515B]|uniref:SAM-dependent methyltransferase n=1 Tax=Nonomuraea sp. 10N515B TaxID=3457422 RepID=UPI003FCD0606